MGSKNILYKTNVSKISWGNFIIYDQNRTQGKKKKRKINQIEKGLV